MPYLSTQHWLDYFSTSQYAAPAYKTITVGTATVDSAGAAGTSRSFNFTTTAGCTMVAAWLHLKGSTVDPTGAGGTFNSVALTAISGATATNSTARNFVQAFHLLTPSIGTYTLAFSWTGTATPVISVMEIFNCSTAPTNGNGATGASTSLAVTITTASGRTVLAAGTVGNSTLTLTTSGATATHNANQSTTMRGAGSKVTASGATQANTWTAGTSSNWAAAGFDLVPDLSA